MPANHKVSVAWQIVFTFLPIVNFWAFYRIKKLRKYLLYIILPNVVFSIAFYYYINGIWVESPYDFVTPQSPSIVLATVVGVGLKALEIYLVIIWSRKHNKQFDQPAGQDATPAA